MTVNVATGSPPQTAAFAAGPDGATDTRIDGGGVNRGGAELLVIGPEIPDVRALVAMATRACQVVHLPDAADGLTALAAAVEIFGPVAAVHVVGHGAPGRLRLGRTDLTLDEVRRRPAHVAALGKAIAGAPVLLYGCEVGAGAAGKRFVDDLGSALGAPVRASTTAVGCAALGGSWTLDAGHAAAEPLFDPGRTAAGWQWLLCASGRQSCGAQPTPAARAPRG